MEPSKLLWSSHQHRHLQDSSTQHSTRSTVHRPNDCDQFACWCCCRSEWGAHCTCVLCIWYKASKFWNWFFFRNDKRIRSAWSTEHRVDFEWMTKQPCCRFDSDYQLWTRRNSSSSVLKWTRKNVAVLVVGVRLKAARSQLTQVEHFSWNLFYFS